MRYLLALIVIFSLSHYSIAEVPLLDSLENVLKTSDNREEQIEATIKIGQHYNQLGMDTSAVFFNNALDMATRDGNRKLAANACMSLASYYGYLAQETDQAYAIACKARDLVSYMGDTSKLYINYCGKTELYHGMYEIDQGNYTNAQEFFFDAIEEFEKIDEQRSILIAYNQLVSLYGIQEMFLEAEDILTKTIQLCEKNNWIYEKMIFLSNRGSIQYLQGRFSESISSMNDAERTIYSHLDTTDYYNLSLIYSCKGSDYYELGNYDSSYHYHKKSLYCSQATQIPSTIISAYSDLAQDCVVRGDLRQAKFYCEKMQLGIDSTQNPQEEMVALIGWIKYHEAASEFELALEKTTKLMELREAAINEQNIEEQTSQKMTFEFEKERLLSNNEIQIKNEKLVTEQAYNSKLKIGLIVLVTSLFVMALLFYLNIKQKRIISNKNEKLNNSIKEKETLLKEIHHRVKNNLQLVSSLLDLQSKSIDNDQIISVFEEGQNRVQAMALIHQKLYQNDISSEIDFEDYLNALAGHFDHLNVSPKVDFEIDCKDIRLDIDTAIPLGLIINELFTNAYKHAFKNIDLPKVSVSIKNEGSGEYIMKISDNGQGLPPDLDWSKTKTLGLRLIRNLVKQLIGKIDYDNLGNLSVFSIQFKNQFGRNLLD